MRSKSALLLALVVKRSGAEAWEAVLPQIVAYAADEPQAQVRVGVGLGKGEENEEAPCGGR